MSDLLRFGLLGGSSEEEEEEEPAFDDPLAVTGLSAQRLSRTLTATTTSLHGKQQPLPLASKPAPRLPPRPRPRTITGSVMELPSQLVGLRGALTSVAPFLCATSEARLISVCRTLYGGGTAEMPSSALAMDPSCAALLVSLGPCREALQRGLIGISAAAVANAGLRLEAVEGAGAADPSRGGLAQVAARSERHRVAVAKQLWRCRTLISFALREAEKATSELRRLDAEQQRSESLMALMPGTAKLAPTPAAAAASATRRRIKTRASSEGLFGGVALPDRDDVAGSTPSKKVRAVAKTDEELMAIWIEKLEGEPDYQDLKNRIVRFKRAVHLSRLPANRPKHQPLENLISERLQAFLCETREMISNMERYYERGGGGDALAMNDRLLLESQLLEDFSSPALHTVSELSEVANQKYALMLRTLHDTELNMTAAHLGEVAGKLNAMVVDLASAELRPILSHATPHAMLQCAVRCCRLISGALNLRMRSDRDNSHVGADDFLPTFIWVVLKARVPELVTAIRFIEMYHDPELLLMAEAGYCFANLTSAVMFLENFSRSSALEMGLDVNVFDAALERATADSVARASEQRAGPKRRTTLHNIFQKKLELTLAFKNIPSRDAKKKSAHARRDSGRRASAAPASLAASASAVNAPAARARSSSRRASTNSLPSAGSSKLATPLTAGDRKAAEKRRAQCLAAAAASAAGLESTFSAGNHGQTYSVRLSVRNEDRSLSELTLRAVCAPSALVLCDNNTTAAKPRYLWAYDNILKWITKPDTFTLMLSARQVDGFGSPGESVQVVLRTAEASTISTAMMKQIGNLLKN